MMRWAAKKLLRLTLGSEWFKFFFAITFMVLYHVYFNKLKEAIIMYQSEVVCDSNSDPVFFLTATSKNHLNETLNQLAFLQMDKTIRTPHVYINDIMHDLDISDIEKLMHINGVKTTVNRFNYKLLGFNTSYPTPDIMRVIMGPTNSMWKPPLLNFYYRKLEKHVKCFYLVYMDACIYFTPDFFQMKTWKRAEKFGVLPFENPGTRLRRNTHPRSFEILQDLTNGFTGNVSSYKRVHTVMGGFHIWRGGHKFAREIITYWKDCALNYTCMAPPGASGFKHNPVGSDVCIRDLLGHCHRGDQSILSILLSTYSKNTGLTPAVENSTFALDIIMPNRSAYSKGGVHCLNSKRKDFKLKTPKYG